MFKGGQYSGVHLSLSYTQLIQPLLPYIPFLRLLRPLPHSRYGRYILSSSAFLVSILFMYSCFLVILSKSYISSSFQFVTPYLYDTTGTASLLIADILFLALSSDLSTSLIPL